MMYNPAGFNPTGLDMDSALGDPRRQEKLPGGWSNQGQMVSAPYAQANIMAAQKTNPMNAASQMPVSDRVEQFLATMRSGKV